MPLVPLEVAKASQELHLGTIPVRLGWVGGKNPTSVQLNFQLPTETELL